jgi:hypothetical protein
VGTAWGKREPSRVDIDASTGGRYYQASTATSRIVRREVQCAREKVSAVK